MTSVAWILYTRGMKKRIFNWFFILLLLSGLSVTVSGCGMSKGKTNASYPEVVYPGETFIQNDNRKVGYTPSREFLKLQKHKSPISVWENQEKTRIYRIDLDRELLTIIDKNKNSQPVESTIKVGRGPVGVIGNLDDTYVYVTNMKEGSVSAVSINNRQVDKVLKTGFNPYCLTFNSDHSILYVVNRFGDRVFEIDPVKFELKGTTRIIDLDVDVRLDSCYGSCHEDKRKRIKTAMANRKAIVVEQEFREKLEKIRLQKPTVSFSEDGIKLLRIQAEHL